MISNTDVIVFKFNTVLVIAFVVTNIDTNSIKIRLIREHPKLRMSDV